MSIHPYKYMYVYLTLMSISERLSQLDFKIHKVNHQDCIAVDRDVTSH
jgi:hypothetical protein